PPSRSRGHPSPGSRPCPRPQRVLRYAPERFPHRGYRRDIARPEPSRDRDSWALAIALCHSSSVSEGWLRRECPLPFVDSSWFHSVHHQGAREAESQLRSATQSLRHPCTFG